MMPSDGCNPNIPTSPAQYAAPGHNSGQQMAHVFQEYGPNTPTQPRSGNGQQDAQQAMMPSSSSGLTSRPKNPRSAHTTTVSPLNIHSANSATSSSKMPQKSSWDPFPSPKHPSSLLLPGLGIFGPAVKAEGAKVDHGNTTGIVRSTDETENQVLAAQEPTAEELAVWTSKTFPMVKRGFGELRIVADQPRFMPVADRDAYRHGVMAKQQDDGSDSQCSNGSSTLSENMLRRHPDLLQTGAPVWHMTRTEDSFDNLMLSDENLVEAFPFASTVLRHLNPEVFQMPYGVS